MLPSVDNSPPAANGQVQKKQIVRVKVERVELNDSKIVRCLSDTIGGCFTHYFRGRSQFCHGKDCNPLMHKTDATWKGYIAAEWYIEQLAAWRPIVMEITEHAELDMRGLYRRGQIWNFYRPSDASKKNPPTFAALLEERSPESMPPAFDILPVLQTLYHTMNIDLGVLNPLPPRVLLYDSADPPPEFLREKVEQQQAAQAEQARKLREMAERDKARMDAARAKRARTG